MAFKPLPIGIDDFGELIQGGYYYVDKTWLIKELLDMKGKVSLFTRPRRFGKSLNISMLQYYFEDTHDEEVNGQNRSLFQGMRIMKAGELYTSQMNGYPVISLSLKSAKQPTYSSAYFKLCVELTGEFDRHRRVMEYLPEEKKAEYQRFLNRTASPDEYSGALKFLSEVLRETYNKKVIILIDEYDVPLEHAWFAGYYDEMVDFLRSLFESALKTNPCLEFAVMTGCLRISKESIFTGLNNLKIISILTDTYGEHFGFQQSEVDAMLAFYDREKKHDTVKSWYDGYLFGKSEVYNPWSVINYIEALALNPHALPVPYWSNTSSNAIVKNLVEQADSEVKSEIELLLAGETIEKPVHEDITYGDIYYSEDNLWNFLFFTGYLKKTDVRMSGDLRYVSLAIPNREVRYIYNNTITNWFRDDIKMRNLSLLYRALVDGEAEEFQKELAALLMNSISYMDGREEFYHGFLLGILKNMREYIVTSNREGGLGRFDIAVRSLDVTKTPIIMELKIADTYNGMAGACDAALEQISEKHYNDWLPDEGYTEVLDYGIAFFKKQCRVKVIRKKM